MSKRLDILNSFYTNPQRVIQTEEVILETGIYTSDNGQHMITLEHRKDYSFDEEDVEYALFKDRETGIGVREWTRNGSYQLKYVLDPDKVVEMAEELVVSDDS